MTKSRSRERFIDVRVGLRLRGWICTRLRFRVCSWLLFCAFAWSIFIGSGVSVNVSASCNRKSAKYGYEYLLHDLFLIFSQQK